LKVTSCHLLRHCYRKLLESFAIKWFFSDWKNNLFLLLFYYYRHSCLMLTLFSMSYPAFLPGFTNRILILNTVWNFTRMFWWFLDLLNLGVFKTRVCVVLTFMASTQTTMNIQLFNVALTQIYNSKTPGWCGGGIYK
jgi:hypothetical protein